MVAVGGQPSRLRIESTAGGLAYWRSGPETQRSFCRQCGTPIGFHHDDPARDRITVWRGLFDDPSGLIPSSQIWTDSRPDWVCTIEALPGTPQNRRLP